MQLLRVKALFQLRRPLIVTPDANFLKEYALQELGVIKGRTFTRRADYMGATFKPYTRPYLLRRLRRGLPGDPPNLVFTGEMRRSLAVLRADAQQAVLGFRDQKAEQRAGWVQDQKARAFMRLTPEREQKFGKAVQTFMRLANR